MQQRVRRGNNSPLLLSLSLQRCVLSPSATMRSSSYSRTFVGCTLKLTLNVYMYIYILFFRFIFLFIFCLFFYLPSSVPSGVQAYFTKDRSNAGDILHTWWIPSSRVRSNSPIEDAADLSLSFAHPYILLYVDIVPLHILYIPAKRERVKFLVCK